MTFSTLLDVRGLSKIFGAVTAASDISISVSPGEVVGIVGANGAGKTVFVNLITGYVKPTAGTVLLQGQDITLLQPRQITRLGICRSFQVSQLFMNMTVFENLLLALSIIRASEVNLLSNIRSSKNIAEVEQMLENFRLQDRCNQPVRELSQGLRKLLDIAMAMVSNQKILMLDEPTSGISTEEKFDFMEAVMDALAKTSVTMFIIEHDMDIIQRFVSRVLAFAQGRIVCDAAPQDALRNPQVVQYVLGANGALD